MKYLPILKLISTSSLLSIVCLSISYADTYPKNLFKISQMKVDSVRQPHGLDWYLKSRESKVILTSIASYMGVDPSYVSLAIDVLPSASVQGEETFYDLPLAPGYKYCASRVGVTSLNPGSGNRAAVIDAKVFENGHLGVYTWTPVNHFGEGKSWAEADVQVMGILNSYYTEYVNKGICQQVSGSHEQLFSCRGNPCNGGSHGQMQDVGSVVQDLKSGW
ncbi:hypothetical protein [Methylomonas methanica]|uniref:Uncharacterized protein n=1 Tax=Methylomonas methanica (strain DSM 25384 / MC09) TaxID=857087 RepID=F9ZY75_METMM|nr:hypothetical protein [Methylomonas methanica]AEF99805.1 hypothetical protein Metme_1382 [Methylomonas methanica MC09]